MGGSHQSSPAAVIQPSFTGLQLQTATNALPIPLVWGVNLVAPNIFWNADFAALPQYTETATGGKGGGTRYMQEVSGYTYQIAIMLGLCEGPINGIGTLWQGQSTYSLSDLNLSEFNGSTPQGTWGYLSSNHGSQAISYPGVAYLASPNFGLGSSATLNLTYAEVYGPLSGSSGVTSYDADPALIIQDFLINAQYGVGFPAVSIDAVALFGSSGDASYQSYCKAAGLALSPSLTDQEAANSILSRWLQLTNATAVWSGGRLKIIPYGDTPIAGANAFTPNLTPVYNLSDDDFIYTEGEDPVQVSRTDPYAAYNMQAVEIFYRGNSYAATPIVAFDQNAIDLYGLRIASTITAHEICDSEIALNAAQLILQRGLYIRNTYTFKLSWEYCLLEPMDLVTISDPGLGLVNTAVRITEIDEDGNGLLNIVAEEFPAGTATAVAYPIQTSSGTVFNRNIAPAAVNRQLIFEPPAALTKSGQGEVWIGASGGSAGIADPNWGGAILWISIDNVTYTVIGTVAEPVRQGFLTAPLNMASGQTSTAPPFVVTDTVNTLAVNLSESGGALSSATVQSVQNAGTLCLVGNELIAYEIAVLTGTNSYALTNLARGLYGSSPSIHASGAAFTRLDDAIFKYVLPSAYIGETFYLKCQSFNIFGSAVEDLSACTAYTYKSAGSGILGPVAQALAAGGNVDCGAASAAAAEADDFGLASDPYPNIVDLGLASS